MPPLTRIPPLEFRSLLLPPIRVPLLAIHSLYHPRCAPTGLRDARPAQCFAQRRSLHLYKTARAKTVLGMHKVITFNPYEITKPNESEHRVNLVQSNKNPKIVAEDVSLQELYDKHIKPGCMLYFTHSVKKNIAENFEKLVEERIPDVVRNYAIVKAHSTFVKVEAGQAGAQLGALKVVMLRLSSPVEYFKLSLDRAYQFIENGSPVEFRIRVKGAHVGKEERLKPGNAEVWPWMHKHFPHLRPDFILKAMPEGSIYLINPVSDGRIVQFVICKPVAQMPPLDLTERLLKVKGKVTESIQQGMQGQLPKILRRELQAAGSEDYSVRTGMPRQQAMTRGEWNDGQGSGGPGSEKAAVADDRYMILTKKALNKSRPMQKKSAERTRK